MLHLQQLGHVNVGQSYKIFSDSIYSTLELKNSDWIKWSLDSEEADQNTKISTHSKVRLSIFLQKNVQLVSTVASLSGGPQINPCHHQYLSRKTQTILLVCSPGS